MTRFQLVFRRDGEVTRSEFHASSFENEPHIDGRLVIDGGTYPIRGVEWLLRREDVGDGPRFVCTPLGEPAERDPLRLDSTQRERPAARVHA